MREDGEQDRGQCWFVMEAPVGLVGHGTSQKRRSTALVVCSLQLVLRSVTEASEQLVEVVS